MDEQKEKRDWWAKGKALDLWSIPHVLFGVLAGMVPSLTGTSFLTTFAYTIILALAWEVYEKLADIKETLLNSLFDIILPIFSLILTHWTLVSYPPHPDDLRVITLAVLVLYAYTNISGWLAYRRRNKAFMS